MRKTIRLLFENREQYKVQIELDRSLRQNHKVSRAFLKPRKWLFLNHVVYKLGIFPVIFLLSLEGRITHSEATFLHLLPPFRALF